MQDSVSWQLKIYEYRVTNKDSKGFDLVRKYYPATDTYSIAATPTMGFSESESKKLLEAVDRIDSNYQ